MKVIIIILFIGYSFCEIVHLKKYGTTSCYNSSGIIYLDAEEFELNENIHILFTAVRGEMDKKIAYGFSDSIPTSTISLPNSKSYIFTESFSDDNNDSNYGRKYYYDFKKVTNDKYLVMKYTGFKSSSYGSIIIENTKISGWVIIIIICVVCLIIFGGISIFYQYKYYSSIQKNLRLYDIQSNDTQQPLTSQVNQPYMNNNDPSDKNREKLNINNDTPQSPINYS